MNVCQATAASCSTEILHKQLQELNFVLWGGMRAAFKTKQKNGPLNLSFKQQKTAVIYNGMLQISY